MDEKYKTRAFLTRRSPFPLHFILAVLLFDVKYFFYKIENSAFNAVHIDA
jgi:hypothetical protein